MTSDVMGAAKRGLDAIGTDLQAIVGAASNLSTAVSPQDEVPHSGSFADSMTSALHRVDALDRTANEKMAAVDSGQSDDLVGAMLSSQQASLSFSMLMQVRNKVMGALDDLVKLPI